MIEPWQNNATWLNPVWMTIRWTLAVVVIGVGMTLSTVQHLADASANVPVLYIITGSLMIMMTMFYCKNRISASAIIAEADIAICCKQCIYSTSWSLKPLTVPYPLLQGSHPCHSQDAQIDEKSSPTNGWRMRFCCINSLTCRRLIGT